MFEFKLEPELSLLTATRNGVWTLENVRSYEVALRAELALLHQSGRPTAFIIDIRRSGIQPRAVADALRDMVGRLGALRAHRSAIVTSSGLAKLQAGRAGDKNAQVFTSMVLARDWVLATTDTPKIAGTVLDEPSVAEAIGPVVHVRGPSDVDVTLTATAALETAKRISDAALDALLASPPRSTKSHAG